MRSWAAVAALLYIILYMPSSGALEFITGVSCSLMRRDCARIYHPYEHLWLPRLQNCKSYAHIHGPHVTQPSNVLEAGSLCLVVAGALLDTGLIDCPCTPDRQCTTVNCSNSNGVNVDPVAANLECQMPA